MSANISVVIPLYNHERYIASTLVSVFTQTMPAREVIVVDDGSHDTGPQIVQAMQRVRPELIHWRQPNRGAHNTINTGIARATGDLIAILNSDDVFEPRRLERAAKAFADDPKLDVVATGISFINADGATIPNEWWDQAMAFHRASDDLGLTMVNANIFMTTSNLVVHRRVFDEIGVFANLRYAHDLDFILRLVAEYRKVLFIDEPLLRYRIHPTNTIAEGALKVKLEWAASAAFFLSRIAQRPDGWVEVFKYVDVLRRHTLGEPVFLMLGYFLAHPSATFERSAFHRDADFQQCLRNILQ